MKNFQKIVKIVGNSFNSILKQLFRVKIDIFFERVDIQKS